MASPTAKTLTLRVVSPEGTQIEREVRSLRLPGADGFFGVLPRHALMVALTESGLLQGRDADGEEFALVIHEGFVEVGEDAVVVLSRTVEHPREIDLERAARAAERARERLQAVTAELDLVRAQAALRRALARERAARRYS